MFEEWYTVARDRLQLRKKRRADDSDTRAAVIEQVFVVARFEQRVHGHGHAADLDGAEEAGGEVGRVQQEEEYPLFHAHAELSAQGVAEAIDALGEFGVADAVAGTLDGDLFGTCGAMRI